MKKALLFGVISVIFVVCLAPAYGTPVAKKIHYSKKTDLAYDGSYSFRFSLWDARKGGSLLWREVSAEKVTNKVVTHYLGSKNSLDIVDFSQQLWVQLAVQGPDGIFRKIGSRTKLQLQPYAVWSESSNGVSLGAITTNMICRWGCD